MLESQSRALKTWITANKNLSQKMSPLVGAQGQAKLAKKLWKYAPLCHPQKALNEKIFLVYSQRLAESAEDLNSSLAQTGESWRCKLFKKSKRMAHVGLRGL